MATRDGADVPRILRDNVFTFVNGVIFVLGLALVALGAAPLGSDEPGVGEVGEREARRVDREVEADRGFEPATKPQERER